MSHTRRVDDGLAAAHPRTVLTVAHAWQWGLVTISDPHALEPPRGTGPVSADGAGSTTWPTISIGSRIRGSLTGSSS